MKSWEGQGSRCEHADEQTKSVRKHSALNTLKLINKWNAGESEIKGEKKTKMFFIWAYPNTCVLFRPWMWAPLLNTRLDPSPADFLLKTQTETCVLNMLYISKEHSVNQDNTGCSTCVNQKMLCLVHGLIWKMQTKYVIYLPCIKLIEYHNLSNSGLLRGSGMRVFLGLPGPGLIKKKPGIVQLDFGK